MPDITSRTAAVKENGKMCYYYYIIIIINWLYTPLHKHIYLLTTKLLFVKNSRFLFLFVCSVNMALRLIGKKISMSQRALGRTSADIIAQRDQQTSNTLMLLLLLSRRAFTLRNKQRFASIDDERAESRTYATVTIGQ
jgi:hypothetical protein